MAKKFDSEDEIRALIIGWIEHWNQHNLKAVIDIFHEQAEFISWDASRVQGKEHLRRLWTPLFFNHQGFRFVITDMVIDLPNQKVVISWDLFWKSRQANYSGADEFRKGIDCLEFKEKKLFKKHTYSQNVVTINGNLIELVAE